eukprot:scaffold40902_cov68-Phaeocystis_antarctica.AAC.4
MSSKPPQLEEARSLLREALALEELGLQPYVIEAATLCGRGCNPVWSGLQPCVVGAATVGTEAATLCDPGARHRGAGAEPLRRPRGDAAAAGAQYLL